MCKTKEVTHTQTDNISLSSDEENRSFITINLRDLSCATNVKG